MEGKRRHSHIPLAQKYWQEHLHEGTWAIDATCGNGHDTHFLAEHCEGVISIDIQKEAIESAKQMADNSNIFYHLQNHETFPDLAYEKPISLIVYNLGYLPGGDKALTTLTSSTLKSLEAAQSLLIPGGLISITCYPGHPEGAREQEALLAFAGALSPKEWNVCHHEWLNRRAAPSLLLLQRQTT